jgi:hypothetical protein
MFSLLGLAKMKRNVMLRVVLNFTNPGRCDLVALNNLLATKSLDMQKLYVVKNNNLTTYSDTRQENTAVLQKLVKKSIDDDLCEELKKFS